MATRRGSKAYAMNRSGFVLDPSWTQSAMHQPTVKLLTACPTNRPGRNRTCNPRFWRPVLYQLSYGPRNCCRWKLQKPERPWKAQCFPLFAVGEALCHRRGQVGLVDDVVAVEHRARSPAAQLHDLALRHAGAAEVPRGRRSEEHTSELQSQSNLVCRLLLEKKKNIKHRMPVLRITQLRH